LKRQTDDRLPRDAAVIYGVQSNAILHPNVQAGQAEVRRVVDLIILEKPVRLYAETHNVEIRALGGLP